MKHTIIALAATFILVSGFFTSAKAQTIELLGGNTLNGAVNGVLLGGATMALQNTDEFDPVRIGLGVGILYGAGIGIYDLSTVSIGDQFYISGTFNDGTNSTVIVLLDTFYGAAAGAIIGTSISLINNQAFLESIQYGTGVGTWIGFGFGLVDAFSLARRHHLTPSSAAISNSANGLIRLATAKQDISLGLMNPFVISQKSISSGSIEINHSVGLEVVNLNVRL